MSRAFADTSFYVALTNPADEHHRAARARMGDPSLRLIVTEFILVELGNFLSGGPNRRLLRSLVEQIRSDPNTRMVPLSTELLTAGLELYDRRPDKQWSLTDCISFVVMERRGLGEALTADRHFEQAGFTALLRQGHDG